MDTMKENSYDPCSSANIAGPCAIRSIRSTRKMSSKYSSMGMFGGKPDPVAVTMEYPEVMLGVRVITGEGTVNGAVAEVPVSSVAFTM